MVKEICRFRDKTYRVVQEDGAGGPFIEHYDPKAGWRRASKSPSDHFLALESELAVALGEVRRFRRLQARLEAENEALTGRLKSTQEHLGRLSGTLGGSESV